VLGFWLAHELVRNLFQDLGLEIHPSHCSEDAMSLFKHKASETLANLREFSFKINKEQPGEPLV
jgi:hypothetical protein